MTGRTQSEHGQHSTHHTPPFNGTTTQTGGGHRTQDGGRHHLTGRPATQPPFTHHATHHPLCHPPSTMAPPTTTTRGEQTEDTPPHEHHRHTLTTHTPHTRQWNSARHDGSTRQHCGGMSRARAALPHRAGQQQYTPPPFHTPRRMDTIHSSTHLLSLIHVHTTNEQQ